MTSNTGIHMNISIQDLQHPQHIPRKKNKRPRHQQTNKWRPIVDMPYSHFISVPLNSIANQQSFNQLKASILERFTGSIRELDETIFVKAPRLHLTLLMLRGLTDTTRMHQVRCLLNSIQPEIQRIAGNAPLHLQLKGLATMQENKPHKSHVVYATMEETDQLFTLRKITNLIISTLKEAHLVLEDDLKQSMNHLGDIDVKYHCTIINTRHRPSSRRHRTPINAIPILESFGVDGFIASESVTKIHLSSLVKGDEEQYYESDHIINLVEELDLETARKMMEKEEDNNASSLCIDI